MVDLSQYDSFLAELRHEIASYTNRPQLNEKILLNEPLSRYSVARLGGPADVVVEIAHSERNLVTAVFLCWKYKVPLRIIGGGANILFSDPGFRGVILNCALKEVHIDAEAGLVSAQAGVGLISLARETMDAGLGGLEWAISVPGTIGGAIVNNAGAHGGDMAASLVDACILSESDQDQMTWTAQKLAYSYRESALKHAPFRFVVVSGTFQLQPGQDPAALRAKAEEYAAHRKRTQPPGASLGSMFKNPPGDYAGRLIEAAGLKGTQIGGVIISPVHGNFFVNVGNGTAGDYLSLIRLAQKTVFEKFGVQLVLEVELIGEEMTPLN